MAVSRDHHGDLFESISGEETSLRWGGIRRRRTSRSNRRGAGTEHRHTPLLPVTRWSEYPRHLEKFHAASSSAPPKNIILLFCCDRIVYLAPSPVGGGEERGIFAFVSSSAAKGHCSRETSDCRRPLAVCKRTACLSFGAAPSALRGGEKRFTKLRLSAIDFEPAESAVHAAKSSSAPAESLPLVAAARTPN